TTTMRAVSQRGIEVDVRSRIPAVGTVITSGRWAASRGVTSAGAGAGVAATAAGAAWGGAMAGDAAAGAGAGVSSGAAASGSASGASAGAAAGAPAGTVSPPAHAERTSSTLAPVSVARAAAALLISGAGTPNAADAASSRSLISRLLTQTPTDTRPGPAGPHLRDRWRGGRLRR